MLGGRWENGALRNGALRNGALRNGALRLPSANNKQRAQLFH
jgi:hypothetical protein